MKARTFFELLIILFLLACFLIFGINVARAAALKPVEVCWQPVLQREDGTPMTIDELDYFLIAYSKDQVTWFDAAPVPNTETCTTIEVPSSGMWYFAGFQLDMDGLTSARSNIISKKINARPKPQVMK